MRSHRVKNANKTHKGVCYFLPKALVQILADQQPLRVTNGVRTNIVASITNVHSIIVTATNASGTTNTYISSSVQTNAFTADAITDASEPQYGVTVNLLTVPDPSHQYRLKLKPAPQANDHFTINVNPNGFLSSINASNEDRTGVIVETIAQTVANAVQAAMVAAAPTPPRPGEIDTSIGGLPSTLPKHFEVIFDPTSPTDVSNANWQCRWQKKQVIDISCKPIPESPAMPTRTCPGPDEDEGVFYRPPLPYLLSIQSTSSHGGTTNSQSIVMAPNQSAIFAVPVRRAAFAAVSTAVTFTNGVLTSLDYRKPSQIEGFVSIPFELSKMVLSIPTNLVQLKIDTSSKNTELLKQQQMLADQQVSLMNSLSNLAQAQHRFEEFMRTNTPH